ncbi:MAG: hypothetical protein KC609_15120 [Myxococcales bacterium]|nr:hypothetical protein [Myxococcales bacterium]
MIRLEAFAHRDTLADIIARCIIDQHRESDIDTFKTIVNLNSYLAHIWVCHLSVRMFRHVFGPDLGCFVANNKGDLKRFIIESPWYMTHRIEEMIYRFNRYPMDFYLETPFEGYVYYQRRGDQRYFIGSSRMKRFRRIAEKGSRRIIDYVFERIKMGADDLARERAETLGIPKELLITPVDTQVAEFCHAERRVLKAIRQGTIQAELPQFSIPDVAGIKIILEDEGQRRIMEFLENAPDIEIIEEEEHKRGAYRAKNLRLLHRLPKELLLHYPPETPVLDLFESRGHDRLRLIDLYPEFVETSEEWVMVELIMASYESMLESEIGRSMHEERVLAQRSSKEYQGHLATNVQYLMWYLLNLCLSPIRRLDEQPIKLWVKYMPDYMEKLQRELFHDPIQTMAQAVSRLPLISADTITECRREEAVEKP